ncbi:hypothetical protein HL667_01670 [Bradyrhizobium sp. 83012]|uniref:Uncharacterized protein n=2 Tax=Bradyrhizobium aeschynomenes TaxID=2734909 RepID=A0ABX2C8X9_9BRAD|nr:hypothetical protein [Bradyrhizobium aeschynomenes]NPU63699.1 hypothetical protein [Bradyrhizobium aeschynomenes]
MSAGLFRLPGRKLGGAAAAAERRGNDAYIPLGAAVSGLAALALIMCGAVGWLIMSVDDGEPSDPSLARLTLDHPSGQFEGEEDGTEPSRGFASVVPGVADSANAPPAPPFAVRSGPSLMDANASLAPAMQAAPSAAFDPAALSGLRISSQSWRRGGLGSKALVTFTLRNTSAFTIKDVEINCAFSRRDGSHVTDRRRVVPGEIRSGGRRTFAAVHVGFVNVNVSTAKCALVAATKI